MNLLGISISHLWVQVVDDHLSNMYNKSQKCDSCERWDTECIKIRVSDWCYCFTIKRGFDCDHLKPIYLCPHHLLTIPNICLYFLLKYVTISDYIKSLFFRKFYYFISSLKTPRPTHQFILLLTHMQTFSPYLQNQAPAYRNMDYPLMM